MASKFKKSLNTPEEVRTFNHGKVELATISGVAFGRVTLAPGWKWSKDVKPIANTKSCMAPHTQYVISGALHIAMDNGDEFDMNPGDAAVIPPGHDAWVIGNEPFIAIDVTGMAHYAEKPEAKLSRK